MLIHRLLAVSALCGAALFTSSARSAPSGAARGYIVRLRGTEPAAQSASRLGTRYGLQPRYVYTRALRGFAARLTPAQAEALRRAPEVEGIYLDGLASIPPVKAQLISGREVSALAKKQRIPTGVSRIGTPSSPTARIDRIPDPMPIGVAIIDTGIDARHKDLNVVGEVSFVKGTPRDQNGHGTHVAGIIGARDNKNTIVGVAPGAELWNVRVLDKYGEGDWSGVIAGLDWVAARAGQIRVVNLSLGGILDNDAPLLAAVQGCIDAGVTVVAAAGNDYSNANAFVPARYASVITVSALADSNGQAGASTGLFRVDRQYFEADESFADFSNYGAKVDLIAPGVNILSTYKNKKFARVTGTSQAAPHVAGAAALYLRNNSSATPAEVEAALKAAGSAFTPSDDPDGSHEPALDVSSL